MKTCSDCKIEKEINNENFSFDKSRDRWFSVCKSCSITRTQKWRKKNSERWKQYDKNRNKKNKSIVDKWKSGGCSKCDEKRYWVIDAHHIDPSTKEFITEEHIDQVFSILIDNQYIIEYKITKIIKHVKLFCLI